MRSIDCSTTWRAGIATTSCPTFLPADLSVRNDATGNEGLSRRMNIAMHNTVWDDPNLRPGPMSEREAWLRLVEQAGPEGEIRTSYRQMAKVLGWHRSRVERFIARMQASGAVRAEAETLRTRITITKAYGYGVISSAGETPGSATTADSLAAFLASAGTAAPQDSCHYHTGLMGRDRRQTLGSMRKPSQF